MTPVTRRLWLACTTWVALATTIATATPAQSPPPGTRNVILIVSDGLRWQEIFTGADSLLMNARYGGIWADSAKLSHKYWRPTPNERRAALFPFLWGTVATHGQLFGNRSAGSDAHVTNGFAFSYPGYNEMITGAGDPRINSNSYGPNPNVNVFEWLDQQPDLHGHVAVWGTWNGFQDIFNAPRSHLPVRTSWDPPYPNATSPSERDLNAIYRTTTEIADDAPYDAFMQIPLLEFLPREHPRAMFVGYGETDNWAHMGRYDLVLQSAHQFDADVAELWALIQSTPGYRDQTTLIITADHGRGSGLTDWKDHGVHQPGSENVWIGVIGPDIRPLGERTNTQPVTQSQIAATVAALLGHDFRSYAKGAAPPLTEAMSH